MVFARLKRFMGRMIPVRPVRLIGRRPIASITFDDFPKSAWEEGGPLLAHHGARGTYYTAGTFCGRTVDGIPYYDADDLHAAAAAGHEIACHGFGHQRTPDLSDEELAADLARNSEFLKPFIKTGKAESYAFPYGALSPRTKRFYADRFTNVRGVHPGLNIGTTDLAQLNVVSMEKRCWDSAAIARAIARTKKENGWIIFYTHDVSRDPSIYGSAPAMLAEVLDRLAQARIEILPMREAVKAAVG